MFARNALVFKICSSSSPSYCYLNVVLVRLSHSVSRFSQPTPPARIRATGIRRLLVLLRSLWRCFRLCAQTDTEPDVAFARTDLPVFLGTLPRFLLGKRRQVFGCVFFCVGIFQRERKCWLPSRGPPLFSFPQHWSRQRHPLGSVWSPLPFDLPFRFGGREKAVHPKVFLLLRLRQWDSHASDSPWALSPFLALPPEKSGSVPFWS